MACQLKQKLNTTIYLLNDSNPKERWHTGGKMWSSSPLLVGMHTECNSPKDLQGASQSARDSVGGSLLPALQAQPLCPESRLCFSFIFSLSKKSVKGSCTTFTLTANPSKTILCLNTGTSWVWALLPANYPTVLWTRATEKVLFTATLGSKAFLWMRISFYSTNFQRHLRYGLELTIQWIGLI